MMTAGWTPQSDRIGRKRESCYSLAVTGKATARHVTVAGVLGEFVAFAVGVERVRKVESRRAAAAIGVVALELQSRETAL